MNFLNILGSAKCIVSCGEDGMFKCPAILCRESTQKTCTPGPSTITSTTATTGLGPATCVEGWLSAGEKCFRHFADLSNVIVANNKCIARGGTLAVINNQEESDLVASLHPNTGAWILDRGNELAGRRQVFLGRWNMDRRHKVWDRAGWIF